MMQHTAVTTITALALMLATIAQPLETASQTGGMMAPNTRPPTTEEATIALDHVFQGQPRRALAYLDKLRMECAGEPLYLILRARVLQELIPMDDANTDRARGFAAPVIAELDRCVDVCTMRIETGDKDTSLYLYRGWAWMAKSYVRSTVRDLWAAGKDAKKGKKDLEFYLEIKPDDPTAVGLMGAFLYFADTIPGAFKFLSKLLRLPGGDRERGLAYLKKAIKMDGLLATDWKLILYNVYFYFEGRYEEGIAGLHALLDEYPEHARTAIPLAVSKPYLPFQTTQYDERVQQTLQILNDTTRRDANENALYIVEVYNAYGAPFCSPTRDARNALDRIIRDKPRHPDWVSGFASLQLARFLILGGNTDAARSMLTQVIENPRYRYYRDPAKKMLRDLDKYTVESQTGLRDEWVTEVYNSSGERLAELGTKFAEIADESLLAMFYLGESRLLQHDYDNAMSAYGRVVDKDKPAWFSNYQMVAATRIAEIYAARKDYKRAVEHMELALDFYQREYLVDWVLEGRKKYFERLEKGKENIPPSLLSQNR